jgi:hypothetical protein
MRNRNRKAKCTQTATNLSTRSHNLSKTLLVFHLQEDHPEIDTRGEFLDLMVSKSIDPQLDHYSGQFASLVSWWL